MPIRLLLWDGGHRPSPPEDESSKEASVKAPPLSAIDDGLQTCAV